MKSGKFGKQPAKKSASTTKKPQTVLCSSCEKQVSNRVVWGQCKCLEKFVVCLNCHDKVLSSYKRAYVSNTGGGGGGGAASTLCVICDCGKPITEVHEYRVKNSKWVQSETYMVAVPDDEYEEHNDEDYEDVDGTEIDLTKASDDEESADEDDYEIDSDISESDEEQTEEAMKELKAICAMLRKQKLSK